MADKIVIEVNGVKIDISKLIDANVEKRIKHLEQAVVELLADKIDIEAREGK